MTTHQKSKACRRAALLAATGGEKKTNLRPASGSGPESDHAVEIGDVLVPPDESVDEAVNIYSLSHATAEKGVPLPEHDRSERSFFKRASDRLEVVGRRMAVTEETWRDVIMLDEFDVPVTSIAENADSGAESDESDEEQVDTAGQAVVKSLLEVMAPGDGGSGLAAGQRKKVFEFADACLAHGGSGHTIADILRSANPVRGGGKRSNNADHLLETYLDSICNGDGWTERTFRAVTGHWVTTRWNSDIIQDIVELVQDPVLFPRMRLRPQYDAKRFSHPAIGLHMRAFHSLVRKQRTIAGDWDESTDVVLLLVFFSDATLLANKGSLSAHPVVLSLGNLPPLLAQRSQLMLGLLADFEKTKTDNQGQADRILSEAEQAQVRRALMAMQTAAMVEPLVQASYEGVSFISPVDGKKVRFFPTLFCAPLDHPEICSHLGVKHGYCGICK